MKIFQSITTRLTTLILCSCILLFYSSEVNALPSINSLHVAKKNDQLDSSDQRIRNIYLGYGFPNALRYYLEDFNNPREYPDLSFWGIGPVQFRYEFMIGKYFSAAVNTNVAAFKTSWKQPHLVDPNSNSDEIEMIEEGFHHLYMDFGLGLIGHPKSNNKFKPYVGIYIEYTARESYWFSKDDNATSIVIEPFDNYVRPQFLAGTRYLYSDHTTLFVECGTGISWFRLGGVWTKKGGLK